MSNKLINSENQSIFNKIKKFFYKLFYKNTMKNNVAEKQEDYSMDNEQFLVNLKADIDITEITRGINIEEFLKQIKNDDSVLNNLSLDRLKILEKFYEDRVEKKKKILKSLQTNN